MYPYAKIFSITTGLAVMKINTALGYKPVPFSELTDDKEFWAGCKGCINYDVLERNNFQRCLCTGLLYDPAKEEKQKSGGIISTIAAPFKKLSNLVGKK